MTRIDPITSTRGSDAVRHAVETETHATSADTLSRREMIRPFVLVAFLFNLAFVTTFASFADDQAAARSDDATSTARISELIAQLGANSYERREAAEAALIELGVPAIEAVVEAVASDDPEIAMRARRIAARLELVRRDILWQQAIPQKPYELSVDAMSVNGGVLMVRLNTSDVIALDAERGKRLWPHHRPLTASYTPAAHDGRAYLKHGDYRIECVDLTNGGVLWARWFDSPVSQPAISDGMIIVASGNLVNESDRWYWSYGTQLDERSAIIAHDAKTGKEIWSAKFETSLNGAPVAGQGVIAAALLNGGVAILDAKTGEKKAEVHGDEKGYNRPAPGIVLAEDRAIIQSGGRVIAVSLKDGKTLWQIDATGGQEYVRGDRTILRDGRYVASIGATDGDRPVVSGKRVFVTLPDVANDRTVLAALDTATGETVWQAAPKSSRATTHETTHDAQPVMIDGKDFNVRSAGGCTSPTLADGELHIGAADGVYSFDAATGEQLRHFATAYRVSSAPVAGAGVLYFAASTRCRTSPALLAEARAKAAAEKAGVDAAYDAPTPRVYAVKVTPRGLEIARSAAATK